MLNWDKLNNHIKYFENLSQEEATKLFLAQQEELEKNEFVIGSMIDKDAAKLITLNDHIEKLLRNNLKIERYTDKNDAKRVSITFQIFDLEEDTKWGCKRKAGTSYVKQLKYLNTDALFPDYRAIVNADKQTALHIMAEQTLIAITKLKRYKFFNWKLFYDDVEKLFKDNGML